MFTKQFISNLSTVTAMELNLDTFPVLAIADVALVAENRKFFETLGTKLFIQDTNEEILYAGGDIYGSFVVYPNTKYKRVSIESDKEIIIVTYAFLDKAEDIKDLKAENIPLLPNFSRLSLSELLKDDIKNSKLLSEGWKFFIEDSFKQLEYLDTNLKDVSYDTKVLMIKESDLI